MTDGVKFSSFHLFLRMGTSESYRGTGHEELGVGRDEAHWYTVKYSCDATKHLCGSRENEVLKG